MATDNPLTNILESTIRLAFANNVSVIVVFPVTYNEESILAFSLSAFILILLLNEIVSRAIRLLNIADVSDKFNFVFILLLNEIVSRAIRLLNIADVSEYFIPEIVCK